MSMMKPMGTQITISEICKDILRVDDPEKYNDWLFGNCIDMMETDGEGNITDNSRSQKEYDDQCQKYYDSIEVSPTKNWEDACGKIIETINGYGMFYFSNVIEGIDSGPYENAEQFCINHLHWMYYWHEIYAEPSPRAQLDRILSR